MKKLLVLIQGGPDNYGCIWTHSYGCIWTHCYGCTIFGLLNWTHNCGRTNFMCGCTFFSISFSAMFIVIINLKTSYLVQKSSYLVQKSSYLVENLSYLFKNPKIVLITGGDYRAVVTGGVYKREITLSIMLEIRGLRTVSCRS